ncbi:hypothetical protein EV426DRAFT_710162 [Tirmania nivea]|nr:hypothetical protein EV426DRAFT_710162 [Tirmania nivea]
MVPETESTKLYLFLIPAAKGWEWESGFNSGIMNGLQSVEAWDISHFQPPQRRSLSHPHQIPYGRRPNSEYIKVEYADMVTAVQMDLESRKQAWSKLTSTTASLKRGAFAAFIDVFGQWPERMMASSLVEIMPRRVMYLTSVAGMLVTFAAPIYNGAPLKYTYTIEVFPFIKRAKGKGSQCKPSHEQQRSFDTFVKKIGLENIGWKYYITKGLTLEDLAFLNGEKTRKQRKRVKEVLDEEQGARERERLWGRWDGAGRGGY